MRSVGHSVPRIDALAKASGEALYPGDYNFDNQLYMKVVFADRVHARILRVETTNAEAYPGVLAVILANDVPNNEYGLIVNDQPVLCGIGSPKPYSDRVRFYADNVALVVAESEEAARNAAKLIEIDYEDLPGLFDPRTAIKENNNLVHPDHGSNIFNSYRIRKGDVESAFAEADVVVEDYYETPYQEHAYLQPEAGVSYIDAEGRITVIVGGQWAHEDQEQIAHALNVPLDKIRVIYPAIGGAFGGREDMSLQIVLALAVYHLDKKGIRRPVKTVWSREESIIGHHKRHPYYIKAKWGAKADGKLIAAQMELIADAGAYAYTSSKVLGNATLMCTGPYSIPNVHVDAYSVYTNNIPTGAFRGFGGPQGIFAAESQMNKLAVALNMDPVEIRMKNLLREGDLLSVGTPLPKGVSMEDVLRQCALRAGWKVIDEEWKAPDNLTDRKQNIGLGVACSYKNVGFSYGAPESCTAKLELIGQDRIEEAILYHGGAEVGQGSHTAFVQMASEALDLPLDKIRLVAADTSTSKSSGSVSASRMTFMAGNAINGACEQALIKWENEERPAIAEFTFRPPKTSPFDPETGKCEPNFSYGYVAEVVETFVDPDTGEVILNSVICADDVGQAINPLSVKGQIEGAVVQAAGYALMENFIQIDGIIKTKTLSTYLIPTILDIPVSIDSLIIEHKDPIGPYGARGMGEMPFIPLAPAVQHAIFNATGKWFNKFPFTAETVLLGLNEE